VDSVKTRIYYISPIIIVMADPTNGHNPIIVLRHPGEPSVEEWSVIHKVLQMCNMRLVGEPRLKEDGLWVHPVKEAINEAVSS